MPRPLPYFLALALGVGAALLVACGGGTESGIPAAIAGDLKSQIEDVQQAVEDRRCEDVSGQLRQVDDSIDDMPASVDERLRQSLRDASDTLRRTAVSECNKAETTTTETNPTQTQPTQTQAQTQAQTAAPETTTVPPETTTTPPPTAVPPPPPPQPVPTTPPVVPPVPPPAQPPAPGPAGTPGGGATPGVGPP